MNFMKRSYIPLLFAVSLSLTGCMKHDWSLCGTDNNVELTFRVQEGAENPFDECILCIDAVIFDVNNEYVAHSHVLRDDLNESQGMNFSLEPGEYRIVCWANASDNSQYSMIGPGARLDESFITTVSDETGDKLWYSPFKDVVMRGGTKADIDYSIYTVVVPPQQTVIKDLVFARAHRTVNVYIKDFELSDDYDGQQPTVEGINLPDSYNFLLEVQPSRKNYMQQSTLVDTPDGPMAMVSFSKPYYAITDDIFFNIKKTTDGSLLWPVNLKSYLEGLPGEVDLNDINILATFQVGTSGVEVTIELPDWEAGDVGPIL